MEKGIEIKNLNKSFASADGTLKVLNDISISIKKGEFVSIIGHSGCGKSTLLKILAGLYDYNEGSIKIDDKELKEYPQNKGLMIFQDHRLLPWKTVEENIGFGLYDKADKKALVARTIALVRLNGFEHSYPDQISGGMAQRAAIARALVHSPELLLLDEPFGALDALTRIELQNEIRDIRKKEKKTMLLVTHDIDEAIYLSDRIVVVSNRPASILKIFPVELEGARNRMSRDFMDLKARIMKEFFGDNIEELEYYI